MKNSDQILGLLYSRFPKYKDYLVELFEESKSFRLLCEDYYDCKNVLDESIKNCNKSNDLQKEYRVMLSEIEDEILERIIN